MNRLTVSIFLIGALSAGTSQAMTGESVDAAFRGDWVPGKAACSSPLKVVIDATKVTFVNGKQRTVFPKLEQCFTCMGHDDTSGTVLLSTDAMGDSPWTFYLDPSGKKPVISPALDKKLSARFPLGTEALKKCP